MAHLAEKTATSESVAAISTLNVLLVDDIPENLLTLESILESEHRNLIKAFSGQEALKISMEEEIDLILLDIQMPEMDGVEAAQLLRANPRTRHIPIVFVSAIAKSERPPLDGFEHGTIDFIPKPLDIEETRKRVAIFETGCRHRKEVQRLSQKIKNLNQHFDKFIHIISHDLNAPVQAIQNLVEWINDDIKDKLTGDSVENFTLLKNRVQRLTGMLNGLLEYAKAGQTGGQKENISCNQIVEDCIAKIPEAKNFEITIQQNMPTLFIEKTKLDRIFTEIFLNSITHHSKASGKISISCNEKNSEYEFIVADDGPGIKPQHTQVVFDLFHTLQSKDKKETTGAGLAIAKKIIESNGGTIRILPNTKGTSVAFSIPK